jgi:3-oxoacyl-[acyl-carrier-protein] synthase II
MWKPKRVVITGLGCISPNGIGKENYWRSLAAGRSGVKKITLFDPSDLPVQIAGEVTDFDGDHLVAEKDRQHVSRVVPLALAATKEALEDAGIRAESLTLDERRQIGVVIGSGGGALEFTERQYRYFYTGRTNLASIYTIPSSTIGTLSSEISMVFNLRGRSHVISTGCTSSTDAMGYTFQNIMLGRADVLITGGVDAPIAQGIMRAFCAMRALTRSWNHAPARGSRPFNKDRDGFVVGEGAWMLVAEELERAQRRGAKIYAEVLGHGATCEAFHRVRLDESGEEPARAMSLAIADAGVDRTEIDYVNLHGTATEMNDRIETRALKLCFGPHASKLATSATKSMIGHPQGACGAAGVAATLLAMQHSFIPPTINLDTPDPECDLDYVPKEGRPAELRTVLCNCIGFGSKNSALVLRKWDGA